MISPEKLTTRGPLGVGLEKLPIEWGLKLLTNDQVREALNDNIKIFLEGRHRLLEIHKKRSSFSIPLFHVSYYEDFSHLGSWKPRLTSTGKIGGFAGIVERDRLQKLAFETMSNYGFDPSISIPEDEAEGWESDYARDNAHADGRSMEVIIYPSQKISGLSFRRCRDFEVETGKTVGARWDMIYNILV